MNKNTLFVALVSSALLMSSCGSDSDNPGSDQFSLQCGNLFVPSDNDAAKPYQASVGNYAFDFQYGSGMVSVGCTNVKIGSLTGYFSLENIKYYSQNYSNGSIRTFSSAGPISTTNLNGMNVSDFRGEMATILQFNPVMDIITDVERLLSVSYKLGDYKVMTFTTSPYFSGQTVTHYMYNGAEKEFTTDKIVYSIKMDLSKNKAYVTLYNAVFAEEMKRSVTVGLADVDIKFGEKGYTLEARNKVPVLKEGGAETPMPGFVFDEFSLSTVNLQMDQAILDYKVAGKYEAHGNVVEISL